MNSTSKIFENSGNYDSLFNSISMYLYNLYDKNKGFIVEDAENPENVVEEVPESASGELFENGSIIISRKDNSDAENSDENGENIEIDENQEEICIEIHSFCNSCGENWTEEEETEIHMHFYECGHAFHYSCFGKYLLNNRTKYGIELNWLENSPNHLQVSVIVDLTILNSNSRAITNNCIICEYYEKYGKKVFSNNAKLYSLYNLTKNENDKEWTEIIYFREQDIDQLEKEFQLGDLVIFRESPNQLYILDLDMRKRPCFKKCTDNIIPYHFLQMHSYLFYTSSMYKYSISLLALDNEDKEYWNLETKMITPREFYDYDEDDKIPINGEDQDNEKDTEIGTLHMTKDNHLFIITDDKQIVPIIDNMLPMQFIRYHNYEYYYNWAITNQYPLKLMVSTFEVIDVLEREVCRLEGLPANFLKDD